VEIVSRRWRPLALPLLLFPAVSSLLANLEDRMNIIGWLVFGLIVGAIAKLLMPGRDPGGWIVTILLGVAGSFVGGFLAQAIMGRNDNTAGWIGSIIGAMVLLFVYRLIVGRRRVV
jgi:uncharacterized membrane protein YeaQ/YmgE (transglycosylase-associated protein family)